VREDLPVPVPSDKEILVKIHAQGMNPLDYKIVMGYFPLTAKAPTGPGVDFSGVVAVIGKGAGEKFKVGDEVFGYTQHFRCMAEYAVVAADDLAVKPKTLSHTETSTMASSCLTALQGFEKAKLKKGQKVLILGGSGGTGVLAIQLAKHVFEATVYATCSAANTELVKSLGCDEVIDYTKDKWWELLKGKDIDIIYDGVGGGESWQHGKSGVLGKHGWYLTLTGDHPEQKFSAGTLTKIAGEVMGRKFASNFGGANYQLVLSAPNGAQCRQVAEWIDAGKIKPVIEKTFPLANALQALQHLQTGRTKGKLAMVIVE